MSRSHGKEITIAIAALAVLILIAGCSSNASLGAQKAPSLNDIPYLSPIVPVPPCPQAPTGIGLQVIRLPGDLSLNLRAVGLKTGEKVSFFVGCARMGGTSSASGSEVIGPDGLLLSGWHFGSDCTNPAEEYRCIAVVWPSDISEGNALACAETSIPACWTKEAGMYCGHLGLCIVFGTFLFLLAMIAFLRPRTFGAGGKAGRRAVALLGALATLAAAHCFDCANEGLKQNTLRTFHVWPHVLAYVLFEIAVAVALVLMLRFLMICMKRDKVVGWAFLLGGGVIVSLFPLAVTRWLSFLGIGLWAMSNLSPGKTLPLAAAAVAVMGGVVLAFGWEDDTASDACDKHPER